MAHGAGTLTELSENFPNFPNDFLLKTADKLIGLSLSKGQNSTGWEDKNMIDSGHKSLLCSILQLLHARHLYPTLTNQETGFYLHNELPYPKNDDITN